MSGVLESEGLHRIDRQTVRSIREISSQGGRIQTVYDNANGGLNPLGLSPDVVPFDISPAQFADDVFGKTHFEQIYERAEQALANALAVFEEANAHKARIRQQQITADDFYDETYEQDVDFRNRLIEIFGTPYEGTVGTGKPYPAGYLGPDLMLWMYVEANDLSKGIPTPLPVGANPGGVSNFELHLRKFEQVYNRIASDDDGAGALVETNSYPYFVSDMSLDSVTATPPPAQDGNVSINVPVTADGYTFQAPPEWGRRQSPGELQSIVSEMVQAEADLGLALGDYDVYVKTFRDMVELLEAKYGLIADNVRIVNEQFRREAALSAALEALQVLQSVVSVIQEKNDTVQGLLLEIAKAQPPTVGLASNPGTIPPVQAQANLEIAEELLELDLNSSASRRALQVDKLEVDQFLKYASDQAKSDNAGYVNGTAVAAAINGLGLAGELAAAKDDLVVQKASFKYEIREQLKEIEQHLRNEGTTRMEVFRRLEVLRQVSDRFRTVLAQGYALLDQREYFNQGTAATIQQVRYQDMAFRNFRNDSLQKYRAAFDLSARYAYLAAKAYDYETNLGPNDPGSAQPILNEIIRARSPGVFGDDGPAHLGTGLASWLATLRDNYRVLKTQLGFNNRQTETGKLSLRYELFHISPSDGDNVNNTDEVAWRQALDQHRVRDLWTVPEFVRYCRPFAPRSAGAQPGFVIPFGTEIVAGRNVFGWPLGGRHHAWDPSLFAAKVRSVGVYLEGYDDTSLAITPRAYLVPAGTDIMLIPNSADLETRQWTVVDQSIPVPFPVSDRDLANPDWRPMDHSLASPLGEIRRFSSFRAYGGPLGLEDVVFDEELVWDTRLVGRSIWNTRWVLIIPTRSMGSDAWAASEDFIANVSDIKIYLDTYGYSGN